MAIVPTDFDAMAADVLDAFGNAEELTLRLNVLGAFNATLGHRAKTSYDVPVSRYIRSKSVQATVASGSSGDLRRVEEFSLLIRVADIPGVDTLGEQPIDQTYQVVIGHYIYPVVGVEREVGETMLRIRVRRDLGPAT